MCKRIVLIHIYLPSIPAMEAAFAAVWPEVEVLHLVDEALHKDVDPSGVLTPEIYRRVATLVRHAVASGADGIIFSGSTFGPAVDEAGASVDVRVLKPDEAMAEDAIEAGSRIGLLYVSPDSVAILTQHLEEEAARRGREITVDARHVAGAKQAKTEGREDEHDRLIAEAAAALGGCEVLVIGQVSMSTAASLVADIPGRTVLTTPKAAVARIRRLVEG